MAKFSIGCASIIAVVIVALCAMVWFSLSPDAIDQINWYAGLVLRGCLVLPVLGLFTAGIWWQARQSRRERTQRDGAFPLMHRRRRVWRSDIAKPLAVYSFLVGEEFVIDPNRIIGPAFSFDAFGRFTEVVPQAGYALQHQYNALVERTNVARAIYQGDDSHDNLFGRDALPPRVPARALMEPKPAQLPPPQEDVVEGTFTPVAVPFGDAVRSNTPTTFALGQSSNGIVRWDVESSPHLRVHGQTQGSGKTNVIKTIVAGAIPQGVHVIVLDRRGFKDWSDYRNHVELIDNRKPGAFAGTMRQLVDLYRERDEQLGLAGVGNLGELSGAPARLFVVVSEFGSTCRDATVSGEMDEALPLLKNILSEAGATGIHMIFEDQAINRNWPPELRGNADPVTGYLPEDAAKAGGYRFAHQLQAHEFHHNGDRFRTWDMKIEAPRLLAHERANTRSAIDVRSVVRSNDNHNSGAKPEEIIFAPNERTPNAPSSTDLQRMVWAWRDTNPTGAQADLRREFAERGIEIARSWAHECWHAWPNADRTPTEQSPVAPATVAEQLAEIELSPEELESLSIIERLQLAGVPMKEIKFGDKPLGVDRTSETTSATTSATVNGKH